MLPEAVDDSQPYGWEQDLVLVLGSWLESKVAEVVAVDEEAMPSVDWGVSVDVVVVPVP